MINRVFILGGSARQSWTAVNGLLCLLLMARIATAESSTMEIRYRVRIEGVEDRSLRSDLLSVSDSEALVKRRPISQIQLRRRAERDVPRLIKVLRANGYYAASVQVRIDASRRRTRVIFDVDPGPRYTFRDLKVLPVAKDAPRGPTPEEVGMVAGEPALTRVALRAEELIVQFLEGRGYPLAQANQREVGVEHRANAVDVTYYYDAGPPAVFGETTIDGLCAVREDFVRGQIPWEPGDQYDGRLLRLAQRRIVGSDLFATVRAIKADELSGEGAMPILIDLSERKHRSISLGAGYATDEGVRGRISWEHRNLLSAGERLNWTWTASEIGYATESRFQKPDFRRLDQTLKFTIRAAQDEPDAFRSRNVGALLGIDRGLRRGLVVGAGTGLKYSSVRDALSEDSFGLLYFPLHLDWDGSDDVLDPRRGGRLTLSTAPYHEVIESELTFLKARVGTSRYLRLSRRPELDLAVRAVAGTIIGATRDDIPADERYYVGGGGTLRGYAYQSVGPIDDGNPLGGRALAMASSELRWRLQRNLGLVAFADGGTAYENSVPDSFDDFRWGTGVGLRYFTPVGPLRFDLAFPLNRRPDVDDSYQFYISLGQAF